MAIYVFSLMVNYISSGVDMAQGIRSEFLRKKNQPVFYVFEELPGERELLMYEELGIKKSEMMNMHLFLADNFDVSGEYKVSEHLQEIMDRLQATETLTEEQEIRLIRNGSRVASLILSKDRESIIEINYYNRERLILREYYAGRVLYRDYFATTKGNGYYYAKKVRTSFLNKTGNTVYDCLYGDKNEETYVFSKGDTYTKQQLIEKFMQKLEFSDKDTLFVDRPSYLDFVQPLFKHKNKAKTVMFLHAGHFFEKDESISSLGLSIDYYYWFRNSDLIDMMLVSTEEQKKEVKECLESFLCHVPEIEVIPAACLYELKYPVGKRKKHSLLTVSRLVYNKRIEWIVASAIKAHEKVSDLTLDVYGDGDKPYIDRITQMIKEHNAESYIQLLGHCDVQEVYKNYEIYVSASVRETLGLSVMEAVGSGTAVVVLNVKYGNRLFVEPGKNGSLIDFIAADSNDEDKVEQLTSEMAQAIVELCDEATDLSTYHEHSYKIAEPFLKEHIERRWMEVLNNL